MALLTDLDKNALHKALERVSNAVERDEPISKRELSLEDISVLYRLAYSLYEGGEYAQAKEIFQQLVFSKPLSYDHWSGFAGALLMDKQIEEALTAWSMAAVLDSKNPAPHLHAAECLTLLGQPEEAARALKEAKERLEVSNSHQDVAEKIQRLETLI